MPQLTSLCVFCGSSPGGLSQYAELALRLGALLAERRIRLVYGGASVGLMGVLADAVLGGGGEVIGVIPEALKTREVSHAGLPDLRVVGSMHERKALMADLAEGFIAMPGGAGTLEEFFEIWTWAQLGLHGKPCGLLNSAGYYDNLLAFLDRAVTDRFIRAAHRDMVIVDTDPVRLVERMMDYTPPTVPKWIDREAT